MSEDLVTALAATRGIICLVGAGGKKTTMYALAQAHPGRVLLSSTSHMYEYEREQVDVALTLDNPNEPLPNFAQERVIAVAAVTDTPHRVGGLSPERIKSIYTTRQFDLCIVKADGARARWIKSPGSHEPLIPAFADTVIPVVSAQVIGRRLDDRIAHRPKRLTDLLGIELGEPITPEHVSNLLSHPCGSLKGVGEATVIPLINMVDSPDIQEVAREVAIGALERTNRISRIVLASMRDRRLVEVVER